VAADNGQPQDFDVLVVFEERTPQGWTRWLRPGFRHCYAIVDLGAGLLLVDPLKGRLHLELLPDLGLLEFGRWLACRGRRVLAGHRWRNPPAAPLGPATCVEIVKRLLGVRAPWIVTPWQLFGLLACRHRFQPLRPGLDDAS
jgi:hypothetical protein